MAPTTPYRGGYWLVASDGGIFSFGDAGFYGSMGGKHLNAPIVGMAATSTARVTGWSRPTVASSLSVTRYSTVRWVASISTLPSSGWQPAPGASGYWLVASDGGLFAFGDAGFQGSMGGRHLNSSVVAMAATGDGLGYWMVASDGGSSPLATPASRIDGWTPLANPVIAMAALPEARATGSYRAASACFITSASATPPPAAVQASFVATSRRSATPSCSTSTGSPGGHPRYRRRGGG